MIDLNSFKSNVNLKQYCTSHIGGNAKYLFEATSAQQLIDVCVYCQQHNIKYKVVGLGANLIFDDLGFDGAIIVNKSAQIFKRKNSIFVCSGARVNQLLHYCLTHQLSGLENLAGIPSTVGGATVNNLGAFNCCFGNFVEYVVCLNANGEKQTLSAKECKFEYRNSIFKKQNFVILKVKLNLTTKPKKEIKQAIVAAICKKVSTQPLALPSAGSVFKRGTIVPAYEIDRLGLKGKKIGGAMISTKHAGFIVNTGNATCADFKALVKFIDAIIYKKFMINLETEIEFVNF